MLPPKILNEVFVETMIVIRKSERQHSEEENELMIYTFLNSAPSPPLLLIESQQVHGGLNKEA